MEQSPARSYGFVGTGEITAAIVTGFSTDATAPPAVWLSPRSQETGRELAARFPNVQVCESNQEVLEKSSSIVLAVRPQIVREVLAELSFRPDHVVLSAVAGVRVAQLREWAAPAGAAVRSIPLPQAVRRRSLTVMYPDNAAARDLFESVGGVLVPGTEDVLEAFSAATSTFATHLDYLTTVAAWLAEHGADPDDASTYIAHVFGQLGRSLLERTESLEVLATEHMTPGGINAQLLSDLRSEGMPDSVRRALDRVLVRLQT